jgi:hypothetical protein
VKVERKTRGTLADRICQTLACDPWLSATTIANRIGAQAASVSSAMTKLVKANVLIREPLKGPNGGYGYDLVVKPKNGTVWFDNLMKRRCTVVRHDRSSGCYRVQYHGGGRLWAPAEEFGTGKRFQWSRTDFLLDVIEGPDPV